MNKIDFSGSECSYEKLLNGTLEFEGIRAAIMTTDKCCFSCEYCCNSGFTDFNATKNTKSEADLKCFNLVKAIFPRLKSAVLCGGEPLMCDYLYDYLDLFKDLKDITILTNLLYIKDHYKRLKEYRNLDLVTTYHASQINSNQYIERLKYFLDIDLPKEVKLFFNHKKPDLIERTQNVKDFLESQGFTNIICTHISGFGFSNPNKNVAGVDLNADRDYVLVSQGTKKYMNESEFANYNYAGMICNGLRLHVYPDKIIENCSRKTLTAEEVLKLKDYQVCKFKSCNVGMCLNYFSKYNVKYLKNINFNCITPQIDYDEEMCDKNYKLFTNSEGYLV